MATFTTPWLLSRAEQEQDKTGTAIQARLTWHRRAGRWWAHVARTDDHEQIFKKGIKLN